MNTLLTSPSFFVAAARLSNRDLHIQLVDCLKVGRALLGRERSEWVKHPSVLMWYGSEQAFYYYTLIMHHDWMIRSGKREHLAYMKFAQEFNIAMSDGWQTTPWLKDSRLHQSHKSALIQRDPAFYGPVWPDTPKDLPMFWPTKHEDYGPHFYNV